MSGIDSVRFLVFSYSRKQTHYPWDLKELWVVMKGKYY